MPSNRPAAPAAARTATPRPASETGPGIAAMERLPGGLVYVDAAMPGYSRVRRGDRFQYRRMGGGRVSAPEEIARIDSLAIPPAYRDVWICPLANGHLQATGIDARGRKQYRYHAAWRAQRDESKFERMEAFGRALPRIRARVARDLAAQRGDRIGRSVLLATLVRLLDTTFIRVGNEEYTAENGSFGLTTLRNPHAGVHGSVLELRFRGKSGVMHHVTLEDPRVARVVRRCQQLPGQELFQYQDEDGQPHSVGSADVNDYLREAAGPMDDGEHFTAKDFRTWHGTVQALELTRLACCDTTGTAGYSAKLVLAEVARQLGNTPAVCKKAYVHPAVLQLGSTLARDTAGGVADIWQRLAGRRPSQRLLHAAEHRLMGFLHHHRRTHARDSASGRLPRRAAA